MTDPTQQMRMVGELFDTVRVEKFSEDYTARLTVGPGGLVEDITLTGRAAVYTGEEVGLLVFDLLKDANAELNRELCGKLAEALGAEGGGPSGNPFEKPPIADELRRRIRRAEGEAS